jgi:protein-tyrosine phosphatase
VDDGPATWEEAGELLDRMREQMPPDSIVIATPHICLSAGDRVQASQQRRVEDFLSLANASGTSGPRVLAAREVMLDTSRGSGSRLDSLSLPGTSWLLVELPPMLCWPLARRRLSSVVRLGFRPLLAHPERYRWCWSRPERVLALRSMGAGIQVSVRSLSAPGPVGSTARYLLEAGLVHVLASDAHSSADEVLSERLASEVERLRPGSYRSLTIDMPGRVLENAVLPPLPLGTIGEEGAG